MGVAQLEYEVDSDGVGSEKCGNRGNPCLVLSRIIREETSRLRAAVSPFLTGKITKGEPQVEHLFKRDRR